MIDTFLRDRWNARNDERIERIRNKKDEKAKEKAKAKAEAEAFRAMDGEQDVQAE